MKRPETPIYVVVTSAGGEGYSANNPGGPLLMETDIGARSTLAAARERAAMFERRFGPCRIGRVVFEDVDGAPL